LDAEAADVFIVINASAIELLEVEEYHKTTVKERPLVLWNLELDTLRADLGDHSPSLPFPFFHSSSPSIIFSQLETSGLFWGESLIISFSSPSLSPAGRFLRSLWFSASRSPVPLPLTFQVDILHSPARLLEGDLQSPLVSEISVTRKATVPVDEVPGMVSDRRPSVAT
jgi:hypothetical protein